jgi:hypothetical protein
MPHEGLLTPEQLEEIAVGIVERPEVWQPLVRPIPSSAARS